MNTETLEPQLRPQDESEITPFPWTVESHPDTEGGYIIREVRHEQQIWCDQGYEISDDEGDRRSLIVAHHEASNIRLLQAAPELFSALRDLVFSPLTGRESAIKVLEGISLHWWEMKISRIQEEHS
jgi:hypothetical protein